MHAMGGLWQVYMINFEAAKLAKKCTAKYMAEHPGERKFVSGAIGPTSKTLSVSPSVENPAFRGCTYDEIEKAYYAQVGTHPNLRAVLLCTAARLTSLRFSRLSASRPRRT